MDPIISWIALTSVGDSRIGRVGGFFSWSLAYSCKHPPWSCTCCEFLGGKKGGKKGLLQCTASTIKPVKSKYRGRAERTPQIPVEGLQLPLCLWQHPPWSCLASGWHHREANPEFPSANTILDCNSKEMCWKKHLLGQTEALPAQTGEKSWAESPHTQDRSSCQKQIWCSPSAPGKVVRSCRAGCPVRGWD